MFEAAFHTCVNLFIKTVFSVNGAFCVFFKYTSIKEANIKLNHIIQHENYKA